MSSNGNHQPPPRTSSVDLLSSPGRVGDKTSRRRNPPEWLLLEDEYQVGIRLQFVCFLVGTKPTDSVNKFSCSTLQRRCVESLERQVPNSENVVVILARRPMLAAFSAGES